MTEVRLDAILQFQIQLCSGNWRWMLPCVLTLTATTRLSGTEPRAGPNGICRRYCGRRACASRLASRHRATPRDLSWRFRPESDGGIRPISNELEVENDLEKWVKSSRMTGTLQGIRVDSFGPSWPLGRSRSLPVIRSIRKSPCQGPVSKVDRNRLAVNLSRTFFKALTRGLRPCSCSTFFYALLSRHGFLRYLHGLRAHVNPPMGCR